MASIPFKECSIHFETTETGSPGSGRAAVLFVHGVGADLNIWDDWRAVLQPDFTCITLDLPGHGQSFRPEADYNWQFTDLATMVSAVADAAGADDIILIGESVGGTVCLANTIANSRVRAVVTCSTTHVGPVLSHVGEWRGIMQAQGMAGWSADMLEKRFAPGQCDDDRLAWFDRAQQSSDGETILALADLLVGLDLSPKLSQITCPVLLIQPDASPFIPLEVPVALKQGLPNGELMILPGTRHGIACSHGRECAEAALKFLNRHKLV